MLRKIAGLSAALALAVSLTACGGDGSGAPTDASEDEFCGVYEDAFKDIMEQGMDPEASDTEMVGVMKDLAKKMEDVGTPEGIPDDAREGFEISIEAINDLPDDATQEDIDKLEDDYSAEDEEKVQAYNDYMTETCPMEDMMPQLPEEGGTE